jgi:hypothetical protein
MVGTQGGGGGQFMDRFDDVDDPISMNSYFVFL